MPKYSDRDLKPPLPDPALRVVCLEAAASLTLAASLEEVAQIVGGYRRRDESKRLADQILALRDDYKQRAVDIVRTYLAVPEKKETR